MGLKKRPLDLSTERAFVTFKRAVSVPGRGSGHCRMWRKWVGRKRRWQVLPILQGIWQHEEGEGKRRGSEAREGLWCVFTTPRPNHRDVRSSLAPSYVSLSPLLFYSISPPPLPGFESSQQTFLLPFLFTLLLPPCWGEKVFSKHFIRSFLFRGQTGN